eukprot:GILK01009858.1.p1 GENE.GILK01009858.1~~GILK01009858.1.p1  ORF type:complete len:189 (+),score=22.47 GILK01009858.1:23-568(+)
MQTNRFLARHFENADFNQYWYSEATINFMVSEAQTHGTRAAFVSTPSVFFSLTDKTLRANSCVLDFDKKFASDPGYIFYDFNAPEDIPVAVQHTFDFVLIDPPFITRDVWEKYAITARLLLKEGGKILISTIQENEVMMKELLSVTKRAFQPSIPNLVYQYSLFSNYESDALSMANPEIPQ